MADRAYVPVGAIKDVSSFRNHFVALGLRLPCDDTIQTGPSAPLARSLTIAGKRIGNRFCIHPMEGWDGTADGRPSENTRRRWQRFGMSGAKLIWGGEAFAVCHEGRANPHQLVIHRDTQSEIASLRQLLLDAHREATGNVDDLLVGLQLTHSGRYCVPNAWGRREAKLVFQHPILDRRLGLAEDHPLMTDDEIRRLIDDFIAGCKIAHEVGFDFVDLKHCHGYFAHELLGAHTRADSAFGGSFENRTRFLREVTAGARAACPGLLMGVRLSAFDTIPFRPDPGTSLPGKPGRGIPEPTEGLLPYRYGFGVNADNPLEPDLVEPIQFLSLLRELDIRLVNLSAGSPYYNPHVQRPALYPPSDGYLPPEDPLVGVARQMEVVRDLNRRFPDLAIVGTGYTYLQDYLANVGQAAVREGWVDFIGLGRMVLSYPQLPLDVLEGRPFQTKRVCRTFSDCTTGPRNALPSGCYPLDDHYKKSEAAVLLKTAKAKNRTT